MKPSDEREKPGPKRGPLPSVAESYGATQEAADVPAGIQNQRGEEAER